MATWGRERLADHRPRAPVIVLTGVELFSDWYIEQSWKDLGGQRAKFVEPAYVRLDNLWTLAEKTQQIYLGLPSPYAHEIATAVGGLAQAGDQQPVCGDGAAEL